jgi:hypothetical protein
MRIVSLALVVLALSTHNLSGQIPAKLSLADLRYLQGVWVLDLERSGLTGADAEQRTMTLGASWLRLDIQRKGSTQPISLIYNLDGASNINAYGSGEAITRLTRAGGDILLETVFTVNKQAVTLTERVPLVPGLNLPVDAMLRVEHGYEGVAPSGSRTSPNTSSARKIFQKQR